MQACEADSKKVQASPPPTQLSRASLAPPDHFCNPRQFVLDSGRLQVAKVTKAEVWKG